MDKRKCGQPILEKIGQAVQTGVRDLLELIHSPKCALCQVPLADEDRGICQRCWHCRGLILDEFCRKCGKKIEKDNYYCYDCSHNIHEYRQGHCMFEYEEVKDAILAMKYRHECWRATGLAKLMAWLYQETVREWEIQAVAFVPQSRFGIGEKGYNPPQTIAEVVAREWQLPLLKGKLNSHRKHHTQKGLGTEARKNNLKNIYYCKEKILFQRILLIDDIYTTGATIDACSILLKENGVEEIYFLTIASGGIKK